MIFDDGDLGDILEGLATAKPSSTSISTASPVVSCPVVRRSSNPASRVSQPCQEDQLTFMLARSFVTLMFGISTQHPPILRDLFPVMTSMTRSPSSPRATKSA
jgi:hypothetical protein